MIRASAVTNPTPPVVIAAIRIQNASDLTRRKMTKNPIIDSQNPINTVEIRNEASQRI